MRRLWYRFNAKFINAVRCAFGLIAETMLAVRSVQVFWIIFWLRCAGWLVPAIGYAIAAMLDAVGAVAVVVIVVEHRKWMDRSCFAKATTTTRSSTRTRFGCGCAERHTRPNKPNIQFKWTTGIMCDREGSVTVRTRAYAIESKTGERAFWFELKVKIKVTHHSS